MLALPLDLRVIHASSKAVSRITRVSGSKDPLPIPSMFLPYDRGCQETTSFWSLPQKVVEFLEPGASVSCPTPTRSERFIRFHALQQRKPRTRRASDPPVPDPDERPTQQYTDKRMRNVRHSASAPGRSLMNLRRLLGAGDGRQ
jgi:hypothetical protein